MVDITKKYLLRQGFWIYLFTFLAAPLGYLIRILYARTFSLEEFGLIYSIISFMALVSIFNDLGFSETLNYHATRFYEKKQYSKVKGSFIFALLMQGGTAIILGVLFWFLSPWLAENYFKSPDALWVFRGFLMYFFFFNVSKPVIQLFFATHNYLVSSMAEFIRQLIIIFLSILIFFFNQLNSIFFIAIVWGISYLILFLVYYLLAYKFFYKILKSKADLTKNLYKKLWNYAIVIVWGIGASVIFSKFDLLIITYFLNLKEVAFYSIAFSLGSIIMILFSPILSLFFPLVSKLSIEKNNNLISLIFAKMYKMGCFLAIPFLIIFISFPKEILFLIYGKNYTDVSLILIILAFSFFIGLLQSFNFNILAGLGMAKQKSLILILGACINIVLNLILVKSFGITGVAVATLISYIVIYLMSLFLLLEKHIKIKIKIKKILTLIFINLILYFIIYSLKNIINANIYVESIAVCIIGCLIYLFLGHYLYENLFNLINEIKTIKK